MGFLKVFGKALRYEESKEFHKIVKDNAVELILYSIQKEKKCSPQFGYEFEFHKVNIDDDKKIVQIDLSGQDDIIRSSTYSLCPKGNFNLSHEYGGWMIEVMHENPFQYSKATDVIDSVKNMYEYINDRIGVNKMLSFPSFPMLGVGDNYYKKDSTNNSIEEEPNLIQNALDENGLIENAKTSSSPHSDSIINDEDLSTNPYSKSIFIHDEIICKHPRFGCLTRNIRERRGKKVEIKVPIYKDINTIMEPSEKEPFPGFVYMDAMAFGMGNCCVQVTLGSCCICTATYLYDQLLPICPILLALSSTSPVYKGKLTDFDNRFNLICEGVDDRTNEENDPNSPKYISKSRYSPAYSYISEQKYSLAFNNDSPKFPINKEYYEKFINHGIGPKLSQHFANILVRDPLVIFDEKIYINDKEDMTHFECINSTNWNSLRFKLPRVSDNDTCFKIEVRPSDLQITPFENTAMISLILCLFGAIMYYDMNFVMPITKVDENFKRSYKKDAILKEKFYWRVNSISQDVKPIDQETHFLAMTEQDKTKLTYEEDQENIKELTIDEIMHGCPKYNYPGLMIVLNKCIKEFYKTDRFNEFIELFSKRAKGELWTGAKYIREFILNHPKYKRDSIVSEEMNYDLIKHIFKIQNGEYKPKEMFGEAM